ncbi:MAG: hypothetical protein QF441_00270 [Bacteriovoracaceae bacterium]|jgi:hypothetical protein|nr:hypothetical protein [Halobacteriovoraceae bacterium]MDP7319004.1 hypothetical protein [Bacteriovoracaceae bacterium]|tara:strand:+ start:612 stop:1223 length:612 start_codon:yes stop_codon:yes gene_type:complete
MRLFSALIFLFIFPYAMALEVNVSDVYIQLDNDNTVIEAGVVTGLNFNAQPGYENSIGDIKTYDIPARLILVADQSELASVRIRISSTINVGLTSGAAAIANKTMKVKNFNYKRVSDLLGEYVGNRWGIASPTIGVSYLSADNEYGVGIRDFDRRHGFKFDVGTWTTFVIELDENYPLEQENILDVLLVQSENIADEDPIIAP